MANLTAVLRKTIDGLPSATPQLRAKVYEKARSAINRQIQAANPPLEDHIVEARLRVLEDAIRETEAHYDPASVDPAQEPADAATVASAPFVGERREPEAEPVRPVQPVVERPAPPPVAAERPAPPPFPRTTPTTKPPANPARPVVRGDENRSEPASIASQASLRPQRVDADPEARVGEIGPHEVDMPVADTPASRRAMALRPASPPFSSLDDRVSQRPEAQGQDRPAIPTADVSAPRYPVRRERKSRTPLAAGLTLLLVAGLGTAGWFYGDEIRTALSGGSDVASLPATTTPPTTDAGETADPAATDAPAATATPPSGTATDQAVPATAPAAGGVQPRRFTQRLLPDGTEVDAGPGAGAANAFEEGTDVATASVSPPPVETAPIVAPETVTVVPPVVASTPPAATPGTVPVGQRAVFYEERSATREGSQEVGNVVWSVISEPPAEGQPAEPAIRAVADVPNDNLKMTLTIRRNADTTLPASHVIEIMFDTPADFAGGQIENVQRLALKPTEQARGEPLIGVAGKISDGFFIIALNDLKQAVDSNLGLLGREEWIDIPIAYSTGQRALMSIEKGIPGDRVFKQALDAWAAKT
ncbi:hypothetical protein [Aureimonas sp. AU12]|uniref:hypothetical protein n=1 Tax=Aureimonas sp. AU12 TaxID=1638161 RepID=UPI000A7C671D|nr:hypothetical protein [Aureimonas sp. AU12]